MSSSIVRISPRSRKLLKDLSTRLHEPMQSVVDRALESFRREQFLREANAAYGALRKSPKAWKEELKERRLWENALKDDLDNP